MKVDQMERGEQFRRNLKHAIELVSDLIDHPEALQKMPDSAFVVSMPSDDPELCAANDEIIRAARARSESPHGANRASALDDTTLLVNV